MYTGFCIYKHFTMNIDTLEQIATWLLTKQIPFSYSSTVLIVDNNPLIPAFNAYKHNVTGKTVFTDRNYQPLMKENILDLTETV